MSDFDTTPFRRAALDAPDAEVVDLIETVKAALEGDSNDAEHDALSDVAGFFGIDYTPFDDLAEASDG